MKLLFAFILLIIAVSAQHGHHHLEEYKDYQSHPHYNYHYGVHDPKHHDVHDQWEARDGHKTTGSYSLDQPDGRKRIVKYEADKDGIHYDVKFEGHAIHEEGHHGGGGKDEGHGHGVSYSHQYHHGETNYHGEEHKGGDGGHGQESHGGGNDGGHGGNDGGHGGNDGGHGGNDGGHGKATSYSTKIEHHYHHGH